MPDGSPQVTPVWVDTDGERVFVNTAPGRAKTRNMERDARVALSVCDSDDPYRYVALRGRVVSMTSEGAQEEIDRLSLKYDGTTYPRSEVRISVVIEPDWVYVGE
jgi:PPOX class probable F420-dependent enzyme